MSPVSNEAQIGEVEGGADVFVEVELDAEDREALNVAVVDDDGRCEAGSAGVEGEGECKHCRGIDGGVIDGEEAQRVLAVEQRRTFNRAEPGLGKGEVRAEEVGGDIDESGTVDRCEERIDWKIGSDRAFDGGIGGNAVGDADAGVFEEGRLHGCAGEAQHPERGQADISGGVFGARGEGVCAGDEVDSREREAAVDAGGGGRAGFDQHDQLAGRGDAAEGDDREIGLVVAQRAGIRGGVEVKRDWRSDRVEREGKIERLRGIAENVGRAQVQHVRAVGQGSAVDQIDQRFAERERAVGV